MERVKALLIQPRFWAALVTLALTSLLAHGLIQPDGALHHWVLFVLDLLNGITVVALGLWSPPRVQWTEQQKIDESQRRMARGEPPISGYEWLTNQPPAPPRSGVS